VQTLYRFFALHVCILPLVAGGVIGAHLLFIQRQGMASPIGGDEPGHEKRPGMPFFPNFALRDLLLWVICINVLRSSRSPSRSAPGSRDGVGARPEANR